jgi:hypothetical protein
MVRPASGGPHDVEEVQGMTRIGTLMAGVAALAMAGGAASAAGLARKGVEGLRTGALVEIQAADEAVPGDDVVSDDGDGIIVIDDGWAEGEEPIFAEDPGAVDEGTDDAGGSDGSDGEPVGVVSDTNGDGVIDENDDYVIFTLGPDAEAAQGRDVARDGSVATGPTTAFCRQMAAEGRWQDCNWLWSQRN